MQPMMIDPSVMFDGKRKYNFAIRQANNGFVVEVDIEVPQGQPMSPDEAQRKISTFIKGMEEKMRGSQDPLLDKLLNQAQDEEKENEPRIVGTHVFYKYSEMVAFLSFIYEPEPEQPTPLKSSKKPKK